MRAGIIAIYLVMISNFLLAADCSSANYLSKRYIYLSAQSNTEIVIDMSQVVYTWYDKYKRENGNYDNNTTSGGYITALNNGHKIYTWHVEPISYHKAYVEFLKSCPQYLQK